MLGELCLTRDVCWSDSQLVLSWLKSDKKQIKFFQNRTWEIHELTASHIWKYVPTNYNPADLQTREIYAKEFINNALDERIYMAKISVTLHGVLNLVNAVGSPEKSFDFVKMK